MNFSGTAARADRGYRMNNKQREKIHDIIFKGFVGCGDCEDYSGDVCRNCRRFGSLCKKIIRLVSEVKPSKGVRKG